MIDLGLRQGRVKGKLDLGAKRSKFESHSQWDLVRTTNNRFFFGAGFSIVSWSPKLLRLGIAESWDGDMTERVCKRVC
jgi:hypothetical protein